MSSKLKRSENWLALIEKIESYALQGLHENCRDAFSKLDSKKIPRSLKVRFAELAFRINFPIMTLKILKPCIYPISPFAEKASDKEKMIYSSSLASLGVVRDALSVLKTVDVENEPESLFHIASTHMFDWDYENALEVLKQYIAVASLPPYKKLVGNVNLVACFITLRQWDDAKKLVTQCIEQCVQNSYQLLLGNCLELKGQIELFNGDYEKAIVTFQQARSCLAHQKGNYLLFVEKWIVFCQGKISNNLQRHLVEKEFSSLKDKALQIGHWATLRECDLLQAILLQDEDLIRKVYLGTPSTVYRKRIKNFYGQTISNTNNYQLRLGSLDTDTPLVRFDPLARLPNQSGLFQKPKLLQIFKALSEDFYQPSTIGYLFQKTYPTERFNAETSIPRVLQLLRSLNKWFSQQNLPLRVLFKKSEFKLVSEAPILVTIHRLNQIDSVNGNLIALKDHFKFREFSAQHVGEVLNISGSTAGRFLEAALQKKLIQKRGNGRGTVYRIAQVRNKIRNKKSA